MRILCPKCGYMSVQLLCDIEHLICNWHDCYWEGPAPKLFVEACNNFMEEEAKLKYLLELEEGKDRVL